eukprot:352562-Chlamydomonas_euryale.AAC.11
MGCQPQPTACEMVGVIGARVAAADGMMADTHPGTAFCGASCDGGQGNVSSAHEARATLTDTWME